MFRKESGNVRIVHEAARANAPVPASATVAVKHNIVTRNSAGPSTGYWSVGSWASGWYTRVPGMNDAGGKTSLISTVSVPVWAHAECG